MYLLLLSLIRNFILLLPYQLSSSIDDFDDNLLPADLVIPQQIQACFNPLLEWALVEKSNTICFQLSAFQELGQSDWHDGFLCIFFLDRRWVNIPIGDSVDLLTSWYLNVYTGRISTSLNKSDVHAGNWMCISLSTAFVTVSPSLTGMRTATFDSLSTTPRTACRLVRAAIVSTAYLTGWPPVAERMSFTRSGER